MYYVCMCRDIYCMCVYIYNIYYIYLLCVYICVCVCVCVCVCIYIYIMCVCVYVLPHWFQFFVGFDFFVQGFIYIYIYIYIYSCYLVIVMSASFATPWTLAHQASLSMGFPRQEYWSGLSFSSPDFFYFESMRRLYQPKLIFWRGRSGSVVINWVLYFLGKSITVSLEVLDGIIRFIQESILGISWWNREFTFPFQKCTMTITE